MAWVEYEHPEYGILRVLFRWEHLEWSSRRVVAAVEFDLFTPHSERVALLKGMRGVSLDRSISVSGSIPYAGVNYHG